MNKIKYSLAALLAVSLVVGCGIATGSFTFVYEIDDLIESTQADLDFEYVDLNTIEDYSDHRDNLHSLDNVAILGTILNHGPGEASGEAWLAYDSSYADPATVRANGTRIFVSPGIPIGITLNIDWEDGLSYIENFSEIQTAVLDSGYFVIYGLGDNPEFHVEMDVDIIFTITAGL